MKLAKILYISVHPLISHTIRLFLLNDSKRNLDINIVSMDELLRLNIKSLVASPPDLILFPVGFPDNPHLHLVGKHRAAGVKAPVIVLCPPQAIPIFDELLENQVQGIVSTSFSPEELKESIYAVLDHEPGTLREQYSRATAIMHSSPSTCGLTDREIEILRLLSAGKSDKDVAHNLEISTKTVKTHLSHINVKLGANNRIHAVVNAISKNVISPHILDF
jgi:DNA-binding NarL/FixJ family response regulator